MCDIIAVIQAADCVEGNVFVVYFFIELMTMVSFRSFRYRRMASVSGRVKIWGKPP